MEGPILLFKFFKNLFLRFRKIFHLLYKNDFYVIIFTLKMKIYFYSISEVILITHIILTIKYIRLYLSRINYSFIITLNHKYSRMSQYPIT